MFNVANKRNRLWLGAFVMLQIASMLFSATVWALPQDGNVAAGSSTITQPDAATMHITQTTDKSIINWQGYSIGASEKVQYSQPNSGSISLNRVVGADPSLIYGQLSANGQVWVINPNGLLIGSGASINVGSFVGSTLNIGNEDFMAGNYKFINNAASLSSITNQGNIQTADGGYVVLISPSITNEGTITTNLGKTHLASGDEVTLNFAGNDLIGFTIDKAALESAAGITNEGTITANGGEIILSAKVAGDLFKTVINNEGVIEAKTVKNKNGVIKLLGGMENNTVRVGGTLDASAPNGGDGGFIETSAAKVKVEDGAIITTYAPYGKTGTWLIDPTDYTIASSGGDITGSQLSTSLASTDITIQTSAEGAGNGDIFVNDAVSWTTTAALTLNADGNIYSNAEISGAESMVTLNAPNGAIIDGNNSANNITANELVITTANGVDLDTQVSNLQATNYTSGNIEIDNNTTALNLNDINGLGYSVQNNNSGSVIITTTGDMTVNSHVYSYANAEGVDATAVSGSITLDAGGSISLADSDVYSYAYASDATTNTATAGNITLDAGGSISLGNSGIYSEAYAYYGADAEATSGLINITAGSGDITLDNSYVYSYAYAEDATTNTATAGNVTLTADGSIDLNSSQVYSYAEAYPYDTTTNTATSGNITLDAGGS
ncbi:MAG: filamentous hemagglutinin N-terminal domain-containing protein, partial [Thermodesulfovibrionales bacterium]|nr:filamentous hemagglutinin N-terminal domain-containing protein [Thermodesulfovibrionales bacterium]